MPMKNKIKKPKLSQIEKPNEVQGRDLFQTPNYALDILLPYIPSKITEIWDCAAGKGKIVDYFTVGADYTSFGTDIIGEYTFNFITDAMSTIRTKTAIITNPPYSLKRKFYQKCREYKIPFALLIPTDYCLWLINAIRIDGCEKIIPDRRIDFITPSGKSGKESGAAFHSMWLTWGFGLGQTETFVNLTNDMKKNI